MPNTMQESMEDVSLAYMQALCACNRYTIERTERDNDGIDVTVKCKGYPSDNCVVYSPKVDVQLKATYAKFEQKENGNYSFILEAKNYNNLVISNRATPIILVVLHMEEDSNLWVQHTEEHLKITKCAYWLSLKGDSPTENVSSKTVEIPRDNVFSNEALKEIMIKVAKEIEL